ncbi:hypothetical protein BURMUCF2_A2233 [Burkholderia multivorans CF2]|nr:hypothetical protein BURMUCF2_A2233 [Burkholderia multivorans CF2]
MATISALRGAPRGPAHAAGARGAVFCDASDSCRFFFADCGDSARIHPTISAARAARRRAVRPRRPSALPQGNPGIFSHFLRNYG